jgi:hypothetical protein
MMLMKNLFILFILTLNSFVNILCMEKEPSCKWPYIIKINIERIVKYALFVKEENNYTKGEFIIFTNYYNVAKRTFCDYKDCPYATQNKNCPDAPKDHVHGPDIRSLYDSNIKNFKVTEKYSEEKKKWLKYYDLSQNLYVAIINEHPHDPNNNDFTFGYFHNNSKLMAAQVEKNTFNTMFTLNYFKQLPTIKELKDGSLFLEHVPMQLLKSIKSKKEIGAPYNLQWCILNKDGTLADLLMLNLNEEDAERIEPGMICKIKNEKEKLKLILPEDTKEQFSDEEVLRYEKYLHRVLFEELTGNEFEKSTVDKEY